MAASSRDTGGARCTIFAFLCLIIISVFSVTEALIISTNVTATEVGANSDCGDYILTGDSGTISSPNFPHNYPDNQHCIWRIQASQDKVVAVQFSHADFQIEYHPSCAFDYLRVYDGPDANSEIYLNKDHCGENPPRGFESTSNYVTVEFHSDESTGETGFSLNWSTESACSGSEFRCWNGTCIPSEKQCDGIVDCVEDRSDEAECARHPSNPEQCGKPDIAPQFKWSARVVGGSEAIKGSWPWQVRINADGRQNILCGGSIVASKWVLTAAHCLDANPYWNITVTIGDYDLTDDNNDNEQIKRVIMAYEPDQYNGSLKHGYDIMLLELDSEVEYNDYVHPICVAPESGTVDPPPGSICIATGWGTIHPSLTSSLGNMRQVRVPVLSDKICYGVFQSFVPDTADTSMPPSQFCAGLYPGGGADSCQGDSGGPLVCIVDETWYQVGVISYGYSCAEPGYPGFYTRVSSYKSWINEVITEVTTAATNKQATTQKNNWIRDIVKNYPNITWPQPNSSWPDPNMTWPPDIPPFSQAISLQESTSKLTLVTFLCIAFTFLVE